MYHFPKLILYSGDSTLQATVAIYIIIECQASMLLINMKRQEAMCVFVIFGLHAVFVIIADKRHPALSIIMPFMLSSSS